MTQCLGLPGMSGMWPLSWNVTLEPLINGSQLISRDRRLWRRLFGFPVARARQASFGWAYHGVFTGVFDSTSVNYWGLGLWEVSETVLVMFLELFSGLGRHWSRFCWTWQDCKFTVMADMLPRSGTTTHEDATWRHGHKSTQDPQGSHKKIRNGKIITHFTDSPRQQFSRPTNTSQFCHRTKLYSM